MDLPSEGLRFRFQRMVREALDLDPESPAMVAQPEWAALVPMLHRVLANPRGNEVFPEPSEEHPGRETMYWFSALYLMIYSLGWSDPGLGLARWMALGRPTADLRLALLEHIWNRRHGLDPLLEWLWESGSQLLVTHSPYRPEEPLGDPYNADPRWRRDLHDRLHARVVLGYPSPFEGGSDPLHLSLHIRHPLDDHGDAKQAWVVREADRHAVLILDRMQGWFGALNKQGELLPDLDDRSWHVEVYSKPVGHLGVYRLSRVTGRWFAGPHRLHMLGNR